MEHGEFKRALRRYYLTGRRGYTGSHATTIKAIRRMKWIEFADWHLGSMEEDILTGRRYKTASWCLDFVFRDK